MGWRRAVRGPLDIEFVPGDHVTRVTDDARVRVVARALRAHLDSVRPTVHGASHP